MQAQQKAVHRAHLHCPLSGIMTFRCASVTADRLIRCNICTVGAVAAPVAPRATGMGHIRQWLRGLLLRYESCTLYQFPSFPAKGCAKERARSVPIRRELLAALRTQRKSFTRVEKRGTMVCRDNVPCGSIQPEAETTAVLSA